MAIAYVGAAKTTGTANPTGSQTWPLHASAAAGDVAVGVTYSRASGKVFHTTAETAGNLSVDLIVENVSNASYGHLLIVTKTLTAADAANGYFGTMEMGSTSNGTTGWFSMTFSGVNPVSHIEGEGTVATGTSTTPDCPASYNYSGTNYPTIVGIWGAMQETTNNAQTDFSPPSTFTEDDNAAWTTTAGADASSQGFYRIAVNGSVDPGTSTTIVSAGWYAHTISLKNTTYRDVTLALESTSTVAAAGSKTDATWDVALALESTSSVAAVGSKIYNVVTDSLSYSLHAAKAKNGTDPGNNTDPTSSWWEQVEGANEGTLYTGSGGFAWTTSSGWAGAGTDSDPYCLVGDGTDDYVTLATDSSLQPSSPWTWEVWYYKASAPSSNEAIYGGHYTNQGVTLYMGNTGDIQWRIGNGTGYVYSGTGAGTGSWTHALLTYDGTTYHAYKDNSELGTGVTGGYAAYNGDNYLFNLPGLTYSDFAGKIAAVRVYTKVLSSTERTQNYGAGPHKPPILGATHDVTLALESVSSVAVVGSEAVKVVAEHLVHEYVASDNTGSGYSSSAASWVDRIGSLNGACYGYSGQWTGSGTLSDPYRLDFNGTSTYVDLGNPGASTFTDWNFTVECWVRNPYGSSQLGYIWSYKSTTDDDTRIDVSMNAASGSKRFMFMDDAGESDYVGFDSWSHTTDQWHHLVFVVPAQGESYARVYADGVKLTYDYTTVDGTYTGLNRFLLGAMQYFGGVQDYYVGDIATFRIYDTALTDAEILQNYNAGVLGKAVTHNVTLALESTSTAAAAGNKYRDVTLTLESVSSVAAAGSVTHATSDVTLALESVSSVAAVGSKTDATWDATLALESVSVVAVVGSSTQVIFDVALALESASSVAAAGSVVHVTRDVTLALESISSVAATGSKIEATWDVTLALESASSIVVYAREFYDVRLALESVSVVAVVPSVTHVIHDIIVALEATSTAAVVGSVTHVTHDAVLALESASTVAAVGSATHATWDASLALESVSSVAAVGSMTHATWDAVLALESTSSVEVVPSKSGTQNVTLALESVSAVAVAGSVTHATHDVALALESASTVAAVGSVTHVTHDATLALESTSTVAVVGSSTHVTHDLTLALESASTVTVVGSNVQAIRDVVLALESVSSVAVTGSMTHLTLDATLALESVSSVAAAGAKIDATWDATLALESASTVAVVPAKGGQQLVELALESVSSVAVAGSVTHATLDVALAIESASTVAVQGGAVRQLTLALESVSSVAIAGSIVHATRDVTLALESASTVAVAGSVTHAIHDLTLNLESTSTVEVVGTGGGILEVALALEAVSSVTVVPLAVHVTHDVLLADESASSVTVVPSVTHQTFDVVLALESVSSVTVEYGTIVTLSIESVSSVSVAASKISNDLELVFGVPETGWRAAIISSGWTALAPQAGWQTRKPR